MSMKAGIDELLLTPETLRTASDADLMAYALALDDPDPAVGTLRAVRRELALIITLAEPTKRASDDEFAELLPVLEISCRRLDVAIELLERRQRKPGVEEPPSSKTPAAPESPAAPERAGAS